MFSTNFPRKFALGAVILAFPALTPRAAHAQTTGLVPLRVKIGALLPSQNAARDAAGSVVPAAEVDIRIPRFLGGSFFSLGIQNRSGDEGKLRVIPLTISRTFQPPNPVGRVTGTPYFGVGAGAYLLEARSIQGSKSKTTLGGFAQVGYQLPSKFFVEAKYQLTAGKAAGLSANGLMFFVGRAF